MKSVKQAIYNNTKVKKQKLQEMERKSKINELNTEKKCKETYLELTSNKDKLEQIAQALLKYETLDAEDVKLILEGGQLDKPTVGDLLAAEQAKKNEPGSDKDKK